MLRHKECPEVTTVLLFLFSIVIFKITQNIFQSINFTTKKRKKIEIFTHIHIFKAEVWLHQKDKHYPI